MNIILIGYMGSGKSTVGKLLSQQLQRPYIDLDHEITTKEQKSIPEIFKTKGELYFRNKEAQYLDDLLAAENNSIIALGGGTPCYGNNMDTICAKSKQVYYLKVSSELLAQRLEPEKSNRPLIADLQPNALVDFIKKHLLERSPFYSKAHYTILCDKLSAEEIAQRIATQFR